MTKWILTIGIAATAGAAPVTVHMRASPGLLNFKAQCEDLRVDAARPAKYTVAWSSCKTGLSLRDKHMLEHVEAQKFPDAIFISPGKLPASGPFSGVLTAHGKSAPVSGVVSDGQAVFKASISALGIREPRAWGVTVNDEVEVHVAVPVAK